MTRAAGTKEREIPRVTQGVLVPLSAAQTETWFFARAYPTSAEDGIFDVRAFAQLPAQEDVRDAFRVLIERHDALRLRVVEVDGIPMQQDCGRVEPPLEWVDLSSLTPEEAGAEAGKVAARAAATPLRRDQAPPFRVIGIQLPQGAGRLVLGFHHLFFDHWSMTQVLSELGSLLSHGGLRPPGEVSFLDYVSWESAEADRRAEERDLAYWTRRLAGDLPILTLPSDRPRPVVPTRRGGQLDLFVDPRIAAGLDTFTRTQSTTSFIVLLAAYKVLVMRLSGQLDVIVGSALAGRDEVFTEQIVGPFVKPVALRTDLSGEPTFREVLRRVEESVFEALDHQTASYHRIVAELNLPRTTGVAPVFQTIFGAQAPAELSVGSAAVGGTYQGTNAAKVDLNFNITHTPDSLVGMVEYSADLFDEQTVRMFAEMYLRLLEAAVDAPDTPISSLPLIDEAEQRRIVHQLHTYERPETSCRTIAQPFEEWAVRTPGATAVVAGQDVMTYQALNERANQLAHYLIDRGARPGRRVGLFLERGLPMVIAVLAAVKTGCPYVPLDTDLPPDRLGFMLDDSRPVVVISDAASAARLPGHTQNVIEIENRASWSTYPVHDPAPPTNVSDALYLLYTSGTTGRPKAVSYPTDGVLANIRWLQGRYPFAPGDASLFKTSYGFDVSAWEIFWPLASGARVVVARPGGHREPEYLRHLIDRHGVTMAFFVPSLLAQFLDEAPVDGCPTLRWVFCGGEAVTARLRDAFHGKLAAELVNCCGPTEAGSVVDVVVPREPGNPQVPLGEPASNFRVYVLDDHLEVLPTIVPGEMFVGAEIGLAHGYHGKPALTAERFVPDPFGPPGARMYRTGDLCRRIDQNLFEHLGRIGRQVKIRGMRVELAEVEAVLREHPGVAQAAVVLRDGGQLAACVVSARGATLSRGELDLHLRSILPAHMVPAQIVELDAIPHNLNGKLDIKAVEAAVTERTAEETPEVHTPMTSTETTLVELFRDLLDTPGVGVDDSFFELGGHSLLVFRLAARCSELLGVKPSVTDIFSAPTVRGLAALIDRGATRDKLLVHLAGEHGRPVLVLVHAASGSVLSFQAVAEHLADGFDVYGLQTPSGEHAPLSIAELADRHADAVAGAGLVPAAVVGWSMGGCIALELARRWRTEGRGTAVLLLDTWLPPLLIEDRAVVEAVHCALGAVDLGIPAEEWATLRGDDLGELRVTFDRNKAAFLGYRPPSFDFPVTLLKAVDPYPSPEVKFPAEYLEGDRGFGRLVPAIATRDIAGDHLSALATENAGALAETIRGVVSG